LECLQRALKLADACTNANPADLRLFVSLLEDYLYFFEKNNPSITGKYITGLVALVQEHAGNRLVGDTSAVGEARAHFLEIVRFIKRKKDNPETSDKFSNIDVSGVPT
jgi:vacuolar protein sorting-associated protein 35